MKKLSTTLFLITFYLSAIGQPVPFKQQIEDYLKTFPDRAEISIGIIDNGNAFKLSYVIQDSIVKVVSDNDKVFEIGSITKTFTASLLMQEVANRVMSLDDPIQKYLLQKMPTFQNQSITLKHLVTHTSGLNRDLQKDADIKDFYSYMKKAQLQSAPGRTWAYSNIGMSALGEILAINNNTSYDDLVKVRIFGPLEMTHTYFNLTDFPKDQRVQSFNERGKTEPYWQMYFIKPAGGIKTNLSDMMKWLKQNMNADSNHHSYLSETQNPLADSIAISGTNVTMGIGWWHYRPDNVKRIIYHEGGTLGQTAFIGFDKSHKRGIVILCNYSQSHPAMKSGKGINNPKGGLSKVSYLGLQILKSGGTSLN